MSSRASCFAALALVAFGACTPFDILGYDEEVIDKGNSAGADDPLADDKIEDKHPVFDPDYTVVEDFDGCEMTLNKSAAVTKLDVVPYGAGDPFDGALYSTYAAALQALGPRTTIPSMEVLDASLKPFNDGLYAAVELAADDGSDHSILAKRQLFVDLMNELTARSTSGKPAEQPFAREAAITFGAAVELGGDSVPAELAGETGALRSTFAGDSFASTPIGFYTWTPSLSRIFQRDRLLKSPTSVKPSFGAFAATAAAMNGNPNLASRYQGVLSLYAGLTNPFFDRSPVDLLPFVPDGSALANLGAIQAQLSTQFPELTGDPSCAAQLSMIPASTSPEFRLFRNLYCDAPIPPGTSLIDVLIERIRSGAIDLTPTANSGWYDRQVWALETLLVPDKAAEKDHLFLTKRYKQKLVETFKTLITERRETHAKQIDTGTSSSTSAEETPRYVDIYPLLPVEPFPTFYLRTARGYSFVQTVLHAAMGDAFLASSSRVLEDGSRGTTRLGQELHDITCRTYGFHVLSARSIGLRHQLTDDEANEFPPDGCAKAAATWLTTYAGDPDLLRDPRVITPVEHDVDAGTIHYWAVIGTQILRTSASFYPGYEPTVVSGPCVFRSFLETDPYLLVGKQVEVAIRDSAPPPTRAQLREICDRERTVTGIVAALEAL